MNNKQYFSSRKRKKRELGLGKIIFALCLLAVVVVGGLQLFASFRGGTQSNANDASAPAAPLDAALEKIDAGDETQARSLIDDALSRASTPSERANALIAQGEFELRAGNDDAALKIFEEITRDYSRSPRHPEAALHYGKLLEKKERFSDAVTVFEAVKAQAPAEYRATALVGLGRNAEREDQKIEARSLYGEALADAEPESPAWQEALDAYGRLNAELAFSRMETPESKFYTVESGDSLTRIGMKLNTTQGLLERANGIEDPSQLRLNQRIKYTPKDFRVVIERSSCQLYLFDADGLFKRYYTGLGMPGYETALGKYTVGNKQKDPTWFKPGADPVPPNDPNNELGTRWMPLVPAEEGLPLDLGIHGTIAPETIGQYKSHGCPRLRKEDVEELYDLIVRSTPVEIVEEIDWNTVS